MSLGTVLKKTGVVAYSGPLAVSPSLPAGWKAGQIALFLCSAHTENGADNYSLTTNPHWTALPGSPASSTVGGTQKVYAFWRVLAAGDTSWTFSGSGTACARSWAVLVFPGGDAIGAVSAYGSGSNGTACTAPTITTTADGSYLVCAWSRYNTDDTLPGGMTSDVGLVKAGDGGDFGKAGLRVLHELRATAGATGTRTLTQVTTNDWASWSIEIKAAATAQTLTAGDTLVVPTRFAVGKLIGVEVENETEVALEHPDAELFDITVLHPWRKDLGAEETVVVAMRSWQSDPADTPAGALAEARLAEGFEITQSIFASGRIGASTGLPKSNGIRILNPDLLRSTGKRALIDYVNPALYRWNGRDVEQYKGGIDRWGNRIPLSESIPVWTGKSRSIGGNRLELEIRFGDLGDRLAKRKAQQLTFAGTGHLEGGADLLAKTKPLCLGLVEDGRPAWTNAAEGIGVIHASSVGDTCRAFYELYAAGNPIPTDEYVVHLDDAGTDWFQITAANVDLQRVTFKALGPLGAGDTAGSFLRYLLTTIGPLALAEIDAGALRSFSADLPGQSGYFINSDIKLDAAVKDIVGPLGWAKIDNGRFSAALLKDPAAESSDRTCLEDAVDDIELLHSEQELWWLRIAYGRCWTPLSRDQIAEASFTGDDSHGDFMLQEFRYAEQVDEAIKTDEPDAAEPDPWKTILTEKADADIYLSQAWSLYASPWQIFRVRLDITGLRWKLGEVVNLTHSAFPSLEGGANLRIVELTKRTDGVEAVLWKLASTAVLVEMDGSTYITFMDGDAIEAS